MTGKRELVERLRVPAYWMSGSSEGHEGENDAPRQAADRIEALEAALSTMTEHYVMLAGCGDCGNWNPEEEAEVISARAILQDHFPTRPESP